MLASSPLDKILSSFGVILVVRLTVRQTVPTLPRILSVQCLIKHQKALKIFPVITPALLFWLQSGML